MNVRALPPSWGITVIRIMAGLIIMTAGLEKFAAGGFDAFTKSAVNFGLPLPGLWGVWIPLQETIGGFLILTGLFSRWVAILFLIEYSVTAFVIKAPRQPPAGGWDSMRIDLMLWISAIMVLLVGPGVLALENLILRRTRTRDISVAGRTATG